MKTWLFLIIISSVSQTIAQEHESNFLNSSPSKQINTIEGEIQTESSSKSENNQQSNKKTLNEFIKIYTVANSSNTQKNASLNQQQQLDDYVAMEKNENSQGFEYNISAFMAGNYNVDLKNNLYKAKSLQPENQQVLIQSAGLSYILNDSKTLASDLKKLSQQKLWTEDELSYYKDELASIEKDGILITHGIHDTYPLLYLQKVDGLRKDITIIGMHLLQSEYYLSELKKKGVITSENKTINPFFIKELCRKNSSKKIYLSMTIPSNYFIDLQKNLYPTGLVFRYSESQLQNSNLNADLWYKKMAKKVISTTNATNQMAGNYLPMLINLYRNYESTNDNKHLKEIRDTILLIGQIVGNSNILNELDLN